jgi:type IV pilus assembly protein PilO
MKFSDLGFLAKAGILLVIFAILGVGVYVWQVAPKIKDNDQLRILVRAKQDENDRLRPLEANLRTLNEQKEQLERQLDVLKKIVPADKDADEFIKLLHDNAASAGIEIRRYTSMPIASREFYTEVPFQIDIDGPYYSVMNFFERVSKAERIVNVNSLQMSSVGNPGPSKVKGTYNFAPGESVLASCTATTFFSHDLQPDLAATPAPPKK